ncbi:uncharacterized protein LOC142351243 [Convolutriloba macropyga]|uniref:uncharacterized protein LOC142351243 n=1 Tax=Convolutriloba macropyga TaxID=536237 RepID=UPI003F52608A
MESDVKITMEEFVSKVNLLLRKAEQHFAASCSEENSLEVMKSLGPFMFPIMVAYADMFTKLEVDSASSFEAVVSKQYRNAGVREAYESVLEFEDELNNFSAEVDRQCTKGSSVKESGSSYEPIQGEKLDGSLRLCMLTGPNPGDEIEVSLSQIFSDCRILRNLFGEPSGGQGDSIDWKQTEGQKPSLCIDNNSVQRSSEDSLNVSESVYEADDNISGQGKSLRAENRDQDEVQATSEVFTLFVLLRHFA